ncbi:MAG TPA: adenosylcobinamide-GDP ribazoletransferase [Thermoplasmataceae archaeon]|nr:adenosylcobinamide-GDP ribazoletransferase [Thermoplasmataceae archaeon]
MASAPSKLISMVRSSFGFFTIIPVNYTKVEGAAIYLLFVVNFVLGLIAGAIYYLLYPVSSILAASGAVAFLLVIRGFNDLDAVLDTGDALMARNNFQRRREILKDRYHGTGAIGAAFVVYVITIGAMSTLGQQFGQLAILSGQLVTASAVTLTCVFGRPFAEGLGSSFIAAANSRKSIMLLISLVIPSAVSIPFGFPAIVPWVISLLMWYVAFVALNRIFQGINGDIIGFLGEYTFMIFLFAAAVVHFITLKYGLDWSFLSHLLVLGRW